MRASYYVSPLIGLQASAQSEASLPFIYDNALAMEYVCTSPIRPSGNRCNNMSAITDVAFNAIVKECVSERDIDSVGVDQHMVPPITNEIPTEAFHDTYVNTTEYQIAS
ncbi:hypothetical protein Tco_0837154 [Tanacetum coccineum]